MSEEQHNVAGRNPAITTWDVYRNLKIAGEARFQLLQDVFHQH